MNNFKRIISLILAVMLVSSIGIFTFAETTVSLVNNFNLNKDLEDFEAKMREAGYEYAKNNGLIMSEEEMEAMIQAMESAGSEAEKQVLFQKHKKYLISAENIYTHKPALKKEAKELSKKHPKTKEMTTLWNDPGDGSGSPSIGAYRLDTRYSYSERAVFDTGKAASYSALQGVFINLIALGFKPAQSIAVAIISPVLSSPHLPSTVTNYEMRSSSHTALTTKWGEVYSSGGLVGTTGWVPYVQTQRLDTYSKVAVDGWAGNKFYTNTQSAHVKYEYNQYFYNHTYLRNKALERYRDRVENHFTLLYGVGVVVPEFNMIYHTTWTSPSDNPF